MDVGENLLRRYVHHKAIYSSSILKYSKHIFNLSITIQCYAMTHFHPESFNNSPFDSESDPRNYQTKTMLPFSCAQWRTSISARASPASEFVSW